MEVEERELSNHEEPRAQEGEQDDVDDPQRLQRNAVPSIHAEPCDVVLPSRAAVAGGRVAPDVILVRVELHNEIDAHGDLHGQEHRGANDGAQEELVVLLAHAVVEPLAVVVEDVHALVTEAAVSTLVVPAQQPIMSPIRTLTVSASTYRLGCPGASPWRRPSSATTAR
ncbi:hypothetical protein ON010_g17186 [Phytophthora cinnamomi]|nr:hypothetical protein ON010_g17186 [Phytophthora cinnamomi]